MVDLPRAVEVESLPQGFVLKEVVTKKVYGRVAVLLRQDLVQGTESL